MLEQRGLFGRWITYATEELEQVALGFLGMRIRLTDNLNKTDLIVVYFLAAGADDEVGFGLIVGLEEIERDTTASESVFVSGGEFYDTDDLVRLHPD